MRPQAIHLLRCAREIEPWNPETVLDLARLLSHSGQTDEAKLLLAGLVKRSGGSQLRRARAAQWRLSPTLRHTWLWLHAAVAGRRLKPTHRARRPAIGSLSRSLLSRS